MEMQENMLSPQRFSGNGQWLYCIKKHSHGYGQQALFSLSY